MFDPGILFKVFNVLAFISWLPLFIFPYRRVTQKYISGFSVPIFFAIVYLACIIITMVTGPGLPGIDHPEDLSKLFASGWGMLTGWVHYLCFDFLVGGFILKAAYRAGFPRYLTILCLVFTFMLGPVGFLLFKLIGYFRKPPHLY